MDWASLSKCQLIPAKFRMAAMMLIGLLVGATPNAVAQEHESSVGFPGIVKQIVIEGPELQAKPIDDREQPILLRVLESYPHGEWYRYDLEFVGLEPGKFDIGEYLQPIDDTVSDWSPPTINVTINAKLPPGQVTPTEPVVRDSSFGSYYLASLVVGGVLWVAGLCALLFYGRGRIFRPEFREKKVTVADRLGPLIESAVKGTLTSKDQAELERVLVAFWQKKLKLGHLSASELRAELRKHKEAGKMLSLVDRWLHQPPTDEKFEIEELIEPYKALNYDEI